MTSITERLREIAGMAGDNECLALEAADEIDRLRAEFELFREAPSKLEVAQYEIERLRAEVRKYESQMDRLIRASQIGGPVTFVPQCETP
jgi:hypothetical protein